VRAIAEVARRPVSDSVLAPAGRAAAIPLGLTAALVALVGLPRVHGTPALAGAFLISGAALLAWQAALWSRAARKHRPLTVTIALVPSHYVQALVHTSILLYWGWHVAAVYAELPLMLAQLLFLYVLDALLAWTRGSTWRIGFGPFPIVLSTNLFLWFRDEWFVLQFAMVAVAAIGKHAIRWERAGRRTHVFNPSAFSQSVFGVGLLALGLSDQLTYGREITTSFDVPHMLFVIFAAGLIVQYLFRVTLVTMSAAATVWLVDMAYTAATDLYLFAHASIAAQVFLGMHLLVTDPATSPRTNAGRVLFGVLYAAGYLLLFDLLGDLGLPRFWDKLLPVPILNLAVPLIEGGVAALVPAAWSDRWDDPARANRVNLVHMTLWVLTFAAMAGTGFVGQR
jgi:hypothetical protein